MNKEPDRQDVARVLAEKSQSVLALGNDAEAERGWRESLRILTDIHATPVALEVLARFASLQAKRGTMAHALGLLLIVLNHPARLQETKNRTDRLRPELEAQLTSQQIDAAQTRAKAKTFEAAVAEILHQFPARQQQMADWDPATDLTAAGRSWLGITMSRCPIAGRVCVPRRPRCRPQLCPSQDRMAY